MGLRAGLELNDDGFEACDDGNQLGEDGCDSNCQLECGNGGSNGQEACDDGNDSNNDACLEGCVPAQADGFEYDGEEEYVMAIETTKMTALKDASMPVVVMAFCARGRRVR